MHMKHASSRSLLTPLPGTPSSTSLIFIILIDLSGLWTNGIGHILIQEIVSYVLDLLLYTAFGFISPIGVMVLMNRSCILYERER